MSFPQTYTEYFIQPKYKSLYLDKLPPMQSVTADSVCTADFLAAGTAEEDAVMCLSLPLCLPPSGRCCQMQTDFTD